MIGSKLSIKNSRFHVSTSAGDAQLTTTNLNVVIVGANPKLSKMWYAGDYTEDRESSTPDCFSLNGETPHEKSELKQNDLCASCPQNAWGSKITPEGRKVKACADQKRLALVMADKTDGDIFLLQVTPSSLSNLNAYQKTLQTRGIAPDIAITTLSFDTTVSYPKLKFSFGGFNTDKMQKNVDKLIGSTDVKIITGEVALVSGQTPVASDFGFTEEAGFNQHEHELGGSNGK
tara:strand:+ start:1654 stop:2349 length:696 start_codon:yes stop_codon:yes gene_type:complete